jgi:uncharacterized membrane protein YphA (DoxX/SURF4 family)
MHDIRLPLASLTLIRAAVAAVWLYEGIWSKLFGLSAHQADVVASVPTLGPRFGALFLKMLGVVEALIGVWVLSGVAPATCALFQTVLLALLNANGILWARRLIHDPAGMALKNFAFLVLAWVCGTMPAGVARP